MNSHHSTVRHEEKDDESTSPPPPPSSSSSTFWAAPPPPPALGPEPSYHTQLLLSEMFSQQATMRNYHPDSIQAVMMALDGHLNVSQQQLLYHEDASLLLARTMSHDDGDSSEQEAHQHDRRGAHLCLIVPPWPVSAYPDPATCIPSMKRDNSSSESSSYTASSGRTGEEILTPPFQEGLICGSTNHWPTSQRSIPTMKEMEGLAIEGIMPLPLQPTKLQYCFSSGGGRTESQGSDGKGSQERNGYYSLPIKNMAGLRRKLAPDDLVNKTMDLDSADKKMAALDMHHKAETHRSGDTTTSKTNVTKKKRKIRECLICQRTTAECKMNMRKLTCRHHFCSSCIDRWLATKDTCPYCRQQVKIAQPKPKRQHSLSKITVY
jgi:Ring finger domain